MDFTPRISRRLFLGRFAAAPVILRAGWSAPPLAAMAGRLLTGPVSSTPHQGTFIYHPRYPLRSELDEILQKIDPERDSFPIEKYVAKIKSVLALWVGTFLEGDTSEVQSHLSSSFTGGQFNNYHERVVRSGLGLEILQRTYGQGDLLDAERFLAELADWIKSPGPLAVAEFEVAEATLPGGDPLLVRTTVSFRFAGSTASGGRFQRAGRWRIDWTEADGAFQVHRWFPQGETVSQSRGPVFVEITECALSRVRSYREQLLPCITAWRTLLDGAVGLDVYSNTGIAAGDFDGDGFEDIYICQPAGLPNRLYRNRGDGTFEDVTKAAGVAVLDDTPCALFADVNNSGRQDLVVVTATSPLLFLNQGDGTFRLKSSAFHFASPPQGAFTGAAFGDYDRDGKLDIYFCLYNYYRGLDQYQYPAPYYDAKNGPPNFLLHNEGNWTFHDVTAMTGMSQNNNRYSFDCHWCDYDDDGWPDLYVVNDFGEKNLYHNNGNGTFSDVAEAAGVLDIGPGMSACWFDANNDGRMDLYVSDMWEAAGMRLSAQPDFKPHAPEQVRALYRRHARGNSLFLNQGDGRFLDHTAGAGAERAGWSWSSYAWDFDHDGHSDIYVATGMISGSDPSDLDSFFWRRVVAQSPVTAHPWGPYEMGWNAINELIRADGTWAGYENNAFYWNHGDGTFSEVSGAVGLDFLDDSRAFALTDLDHDGRLEIFLKSRTSPQIRLLRNAFADPGQAIALRLEGRTSNRDAVGAVVRLKTNLGEQMRFVNCGSGFASQHTRELFFGLGQSTGPVDVGVRWPSGLTQDFHDLPRGHRIIIQEGKREFSAQPFASPPGAWLQGARTVPPQPLPDRSETWLIAPLAAPDFELNDIKGRPFRLAGARGQATLLFLWSINSTECMAMLLDFQKTLALRSSAGVTLVALCLDRQPDAAQVKVLATRKSFPFPIIIASDEIGGVYNLLYRYLFNRHRDLPLPVTFLLDGKGLIVKVNQGRWDAATLLTAITRVPTTAPERLARGLPFEGTVYSAAFSRDYLTNAYAFAQHGYLDAAEDALKGAIDQDPRSADAYYDLGILYMQKERWDLAEESLQKAVQLKPDDLMALNNLGIVAARKGKPQEAEEYFKQALKADPLNVLATGNLADLYRTQGRPQEAQRLLDAALNRQPDNPELNYELGMAFAAQGRTDKAQMYLERTVRLQPHNPKVLDNLGVAYVLTGQLDKAIDVFSQCIQTAPKFDQAYLNLAKVYIRLGKRAEAAEVLRALLKQVPGQPLALQYLREHGQ